jgi:hypothetical protein
MGAFGAQYDPENDPDYTKITRMTELWFRSLDHQRTKKDAPPSIEIALTAPKDCLPSDTVRALRRLAKTLFEEHGGFQFILRRVTNDYPRWAESTSAQEAKAMEFGHNRGDVVRAVQGPGIEVAELEQQWTDGGYY